MQRFRGLYISCPQEAYTSYQQHFKESPAAFLRDCLELSPAGDPVPLEEVESAATIMERFCTGGMSLGAISRETHETIAIAMNRIGGAPFALPNVTIDGIPPAQTSMIAHSQGCVWAF